MNKLIIGIGVLVIVLIAGVVLIILPGKTNAPTTGDNTGSTTTPSGDVVVDSPGPNATISSPITITGKALGSYYFEAVFPIEVLDQSGNIIGQGHAEAQGDWMSTDYVPFKAAITFTSPGAGKTGTIHLKNDNPSGDPANDKSFDVPIKF